MADEDVGGAGVCIVKRGRVRCLCCRDGGKTVAVGRYAGGDGGDEWEAGEVGEVGEGGE